MDATSREAFLRNKEAEYAAGRQRAALQILVGLDLDDLLRTPREERPRIAARLKRVLERERIRGLRRHWSYDLNRHIALKQALDGLSGKKTGPRGGKDGKAPRPRPRPQVSGGR
jgi:hypothetical protein